MPDSDREYETIFIKDEIAKCEDIDELKKSIFPLLKTQQDMWAAKIISIINDNDLTKKGLAEAVGVSRVSVDKWCKGSLPKNRETFLRIGLVAGYGINQMNQLLQRYGRYPALYSKSLEDCICIYVLSQKHGIDALNAYLYILDRIRNNITNSSNDDDDDPETVLFDQRVSRIETDDEFEKFISDNISVFSKSYNKFYAYVKMCISQNYGGYVDSVFELAEGQNWSSSLRHCVSAIRQGKWYPTRNKIISLGLHLSMDHEQIDEMLELAHMEPLCAKNIFESVVMFILDDALLNDMLDSSLDTYDPDELCRYARNILGELNIPEVEAFISELPEDNDE